MDTSPVQAVLFDIGNVLLRFDFDRAAHAMAEHSALPAPEIRRLLDSWQHRHETGETSSGDFSAAVRGEIGFRSAEMVFKQHFVEIFTPNEPMWDFVRQLFGRIPVYLFSNISAWHEAWVFETYPEFQRFDGGFYSWRIGAMKPDPRFYQAAVDALGVSPDRIAYVDDMPLNVEAGRQAGFRTLGYDFRKHDEFLEQAHAWVPK